MKRVRLFTILLLILFSVILLSGCTIAANGEQVYFYEKPAVGFTVENEAVTNVGIKQQNSLDVEAQDGIIRITQWDKDYLQIIEKRKLIGPSTRESLKALLENNNCKVENTTFDIKIKKEPDKELKPFFRRTADIELKVPKELKTININAKSGGISMLGFDDVLIVNLTLGKGDIKVENCNVYKIYATITDGDMDITGINSSGAYKCGRGNIKLRDITGDIELKSVSGDTIIENAEGKLNGDISAGSITVKASRLKTESMLYASYGDIEVDLEGVDASGKYTIRASKGKIRLNMPEKSGWSLLARATKGRIVNNLKQTFNELKKAPSGEMYGDFGGGGPTIDVYVDRGDIYLEKTLYSGDISR